MGGSDTGSECRRHPNQEKLPGVCSSCLRERLSQLFAASETTATGVGASFSSATFHASAASLDYSSSSSRRFSSASSSFYHSPPRHNHRGGGGGGRRHRRNASDAIGSVFLAVSVGGGGGGGDRDRDRDRERDRDRDRGGDWGLRKSRSIAVVPEKKRGFWRRLLLLKGGGRSRKEEGSVFLHRPRPPPKEVF